MWTLIFVLLLVALINIPFGYWRANVRKFSIPWFFAVHLPVPLVACLRSQFHYGWIGMTIALFVGAYFGGQFLGARTSIQMRKYGIVSSSLFRDFARRSWIIIIRR